MINCVMLDEPPQPPEIATHTRRRNNSIFATNEAANLGPKRKQPSVGGQRPSQDPTCLAEAARVCCYAYEGSTDDWHLHIYQKQEDESPAVMKKSLHPSG